jgi:hypothetical protein
VFRQAATTRRHEASDYAIDQVRGAGLCNSTQPFEKGWYGPLTQCRQ